MTGQTRCGADVSGVTDGKIASTNEAVPSGAANASGDLTGAPPDAAGRTTAMPDSSHTPRAAARLLGEREMLAAATEFTFYPTGADPLTQDVHHFAVKVVWRGKTGWAVKEGPFCLSRDGEWEYEPSPSNRDDDFLERFRFRSRTEALMLARSVVDDIKINGRTWREWQDHFAERPQGADA